MIGLSRYRAAQGDTAAANDWILKAQDAGASSSALAEARKTVNALEQARVRGREQHLAESQASKQSGCYIATAVYGSYDSPAVMSLRRFRDQRLSRSPLGRGMIRVYYAVSPGLASHFAGATTLNRITKRALDGIVRKLDEQV